MSTIHNPDQDVPVRRLQLDAKARVLVASPKKELFLRGPIPLEWLGKAAALPGKTLNVAIALWWLNGMKKGAPFKLTQRSLQYMHVGREAASDGLRRLEGVGLIKIERKSGQRPTITIVEQCCPCVSTKRQS